MRRIVILSLIAVMTACASPSGPVSVPQEEVPFRIARTEVSPGPSGSRVSRDVFFVRRGRLTVVRRDVPAEPAVEQVLRSLFAGPTKRERERDITTEIPEATRLLDVHVVATIAQVDLSGEFQDPARSEAILLRVAQVVFTLVALPHVTAVRFSIDGQPAPIVTGRGITVERPVTAPDYAGLAPRIS